MTGPVSPSPTSPSRRSFLTRLWLALGGLMVIEYLWLVMQFLRPQRRDLAEALGEGVVVAGPVERFEPGSVTAFREGKFYVVRLPDGGFLALHRECTHLGCTVPWVAEENRFLCPCHASTFDMTGAVESPPAPRPLDLLPVRIENGIVKVVTQKRIRRRRFDPDQVTRA